MFCAYCGNQLQRTKFSYIDCHGVGYLTDVKPLTSDQWAGTMKHHGMFFYPNYRWNTFWKVAKPIRKL